MKQSKNCGRVFCRFTACFLAVGLLLIVWPQMVKPAYASTIEEDRQKLALIEEQRKAAAAQRQGAAVEYQNALAAFKDSQSEQADALSVKALLDQEIAALESEISSTKELLTEYNRLLDDYRAQISEKTQQIEEKYEIFKARIRLAYEDSLVTYLEIILTADSFSDMLSRIEIVGSMMDYDARLMEELNQKKQELQAMQDEYVSLQAQAQQRLADLEEQVPQLEEKKEENAKLLAELAELYQKALAEKNQASAAYIKAQKTEQSYTAQQNAIEAEISRKIKEEQEKNKNDMPNYVQGKMAWPLPLSAHAVVTSNYGYRADPFTGKQSFHNAMDISCPYGTPILAACTGKVIVASTHYSYGNYVIIDHGGGISTIYAHASSLCVSVGQTVTTGTVIAKVGATGSATGNHLHFGVFVNGTATDPRGYVNIP